MFESRYKYAGEVKADFTPLTIEEIERELKERAENVARSELKKMFSSFEKE